MFMLRLRIFMFMLVLEVEGLAVGLGDAVTIVFVLVLPFEFSVVLQPALKTTIASKLTKLALVRISDPPMHNKRFKVIVSRPQFLNERLERWPTPIIKSPKHRSTALPPTTMPFWDDLCSDTPATSDFENTQAFQASTEAL